MSYRSPTSWRFWEQLPHSSCGSLSLRRIFEGDIVEWTRISVTVVSHQATSGTHRHAPPPSILNCLHLHLWSQKVWVACLVRVCMLGLFSRVQLCVTPWTVAHQAPLSMGFSRQEYWSGLPCPPPGDFPNPGIELASLMSLALARGFFSTSTT